MDVLVVWLVLALAVGVWAARWGRSGTGWTLLSVVLSPLLAGIALLVVGRRLADAALAEPVSAQTHHGCPECRELIRRDARKCKHCGSAVQPTPG